MGWAVGTAEQGIESWGPTELSRTGGPGELGGKTQETKGKYPRMLEVTLGQLGCFYEY